MRLSLDTRSLPWSLCSHMTCSTACDREETGLAAVPSVLRISFPRATNTWVQGVSSVVVGLEGGFESIAPKVSRLTMTSSALWVRTCLTPAT